MSWDLYDVRAIEGLVQELWPKGGKFTQEQSRAFQRVLGRYKRKTVERAIRRIYDEGERAMRPQPAKINKACRKVMSKENGSVQKGRCEWCENRRWVDGYLYLADDIDVGQKSIPANMRTRLGDGYIVDPRVGPKIGLSRTPLRLYCDHCGWTVGTMSAMKWHKRYGMIFEPKDETNGEIYARCILDKPPPPRELFSFEEFKEAVERGEVDVSKEDLKTLGVILRGSKDFFSGR